MARTGARVEVLREYLQGAGLEPASPPSRPTPAELPETLASELLELYGQLGGTAADPKLRPGGWDLSFEEGLVIELDEELHFNRYRAQTLTTSWSEKLPWRSDYLAQCQAHEPECLAAGSWGKRWTNPSCERLFGPGGLPRDLTGPGAPRWKQRALYDSLKDLAPATNSGLRLARLSLYDEVGDVFLGDALYGNAELDPRDLSAFVEARTLVGD